MLSFFTYDFVSIFPEVFLFFSLNFLLIYCVSLQSSNSLSNTYLLKDLSWFAVVVLLMTTVLVLNCSWSGFTGFDVQNAFSASSAFSTSSSFNVLPNELSSLTTSLALNTKEIAVGIVSFNKTLIVDNFSAFLKVIILLSTVACIIMALDYFHEEKIHAFEYILFVLFSALSMLVLVSSYDLMTIFLAIELQSLSFYALTGLKRESEFSTEAALKYFILGSFSSGILLFGFALVVGLTGTTNFENLMRLFVGSGIDSYLIGFEFHTFGIFLGILFIAAGCLFKLTAAPFHMWAPDVYEGCPTSVTAFFSIVPKVALIGFMVRLFNLSFYDLIFPCQQIFFFASLASLIVGSFAALGQTKIKRLLAFSSIGHVGYFLMALSCGTAESLQGLLLYLIIYVLTSIGLFATLLSFKRQDQGSRVKYLNELGMLAKTNPSLALTIIVAMFSTAGIPPLAGFLGKFYLFFAALSSSLYSLAIIGVLTSVLSCFYYIRLVKIMYFQKNKYWLLYQPIDNSKAFLLAIIFLFLTFLLVYPSPLVLLTKEIAYNLIEAL